MTRILAILLALLTSVSMALAAVNVNTATQSELQTLEGIGPVKAKAIIDYRTKNGPFKTIEDLDKVPGIGEGTLSKIKKDVTLTGATTIKPDAKDARKGAKDEKAAKASAGETKAQDKKTAEDRKDARKDAKTDMSKSAPGAEGKKESKKDEAKAGAKSDEAKTASKKDEPKAAAKKDDTKATSSRKDEKKAESSK